ncbi:hypothetical protein ACHWQZ_G006905 [Mnemiopsis leidyi]
MANQKTHEKKQPSLEKLRSRMLSFLHTPPSSPSEIMKNPSLSKSGSVSPEYIPIKRALSLLKTRKNVDLKEYSHEGTFIPNVLLALSQTPILSPEQGDKPPSVRPLHPTVRTLHQTVRPVPTPSSVRPVPHSTVRPTQPAVHSAPHPDVRPAQHPSKTHKPKSDSARPYVCEYCGKQFTNIGNLATHARTHTKEKPYKCDKCDLMFAHTSNLQRHQLVHTGQRNNKCPHCSKCFSRSDYLKVHERTHTGEKPYACSVAGCSKRFLDSSSLKKHERTHTGDRPFACHICYKTYTESSKLKIHLQSHATPKECTKKAAVPKKQEGAVGGVPTVTLPNPFYQTGLPASLSYPSYHRLLPYSMAPTLARPTPTRPRAFYPHPYSRTVLSAPSRNLGAPILPPVSNSIPRNSAFLPV